MSQCYFCSSDVDIEEHHIVPQRFEGSDKESNTVDLCHDCHWKLERLYNKEFWSAIGVEDPRATHESHVKCSVHGCMEQATGRHRITGKTGSAIVYRCDDHVPGNDENEETVEEESDRNDWLDQMVTGRSEFTGYTRQLEYGFNNLLNGEPVEKEILHDTISGGRVKEIKVLEEGENGLVTGVKVLTGFSSYLARYEGDGDTWLVSFDGKRKE